MWTRWLGTLALFTLASGCQLAGNAVHNVKNEFDLAAAEVVEHNYFEKLAQASWDTVRPVSDFRAFPADYAAGFKDGFVDYLQFGGSGQPPYVPPRRYWGPHYRTPEGYREIEDWFAGFRHGASMAQQSGYRKWVTLPSAQSSLPPPTISPETSSLCPDRYAPFLAPRTLEPSIQDKVPVQQIPVVPRVVEPSKTQEKVPAYQIPVVPRAVESSSIQAEEPVYPITIIPHAYEPANALAEAPIYPITVVPPALQPPRTREAASVYPTRFVPPLPSNPEVTATLGYSADP